MSEALSFSAFPAGSAVWEPSKWPGSGYDFPSSDGRACTRGPGCTQCPLSAPEGTGPPKQRIQEDAYGPGLLGAQHIQAQSSGTWRPRQDLTGALGCAPSPA